MKEECKLRLLNNANAVIVQKVGRVRTRLLSTKQVEWIKRGGFGLEKIGSCTAGPLRATHRHFVS